MYAGCFSVVTTIDEVFVFCLFKKNVSQEQLNQIHWNCLHDAVPMHISTNCLF